MYTKHVNLNQRIDFQLMVKRTRTGIEGLDKLLEGGFPSGSVSLVTGGPGSGKTTMSIQFIHEGVKAGKRCLYITTGQTATDIRETAAEFDLDLDDEKLSIAHVSPSNDVADDIKERIAEESFDRIVLDSISVFQMTWGDQDSLRQYISQLMDYFRELDATVLVTSERPDSSENLTRFGVTEFLVDGVIILEGYALGNNSYRALKIVKMRKTSIDGTLHSLEFTGCGLRLSGDTI